MFPNCLLKSLYPFILKNQIFMKKNMFNLQSKYNPSPDQGQAIKTIVKNIEDKQKFQTLW